LRNFRNFPTPLTAAAGLARRGLCPLRPCNLELYPEDPKPANEAAPSTAPRRPAADLPLAVTRTGDSEHDDALGGTSLRILRSRIVRSQSGGNVTVKKLGSSAASTDRKHSVQGA
jgi:hypothetical protein